MLKLKLFLIAFLVISFSQNAFADDIKLPPPDKKGDVTLMDALQKRRSSRSFADRAVDDQTLSNILWAAYGVTGDEGKRTIPTAKNEKDLDVYVVRHDGIWLYDAENNYLRQKSSYDWMDLFQLQGYMKNVPVVLVYVGVGDYAATHAGAAYQNVGLYAAANDMASIVRGSYNREKMPKVLGLTDGQRVIVSQAIGWKD